MKKKLAKLLKILSLIFFGIISGFFITSYLLRLFAVFSPEDIKLGSWIGRGLFELDSELIYKLKPNPQNTFSTEKFRIFVVGDSFTYGAGITNDNETYPKLLEQYLNQTKIWKNKRVEVYNAGVPGYSPDQEYKLIVTEIVKLQPDLIIWNIVNHGDLNDLTFAPTWPSPSLYDIKNNQLIPLDAKLNWLYITNYLRLHTPYFINQSNLFNFLTYATSQIRFLNRKPYLKDEEFIDWGIRKLSLEIEMIQNLGLEKNFQLLVVILPQKGLFEKTSWNKKYISAFEKIKKELRRKGTKVIDIREELNQELQVKKNNSTNVLGAQNISPESLYFQNDNHPNETGTSFFAETVGKLLTDD